MRLEPVPWTFVFFTSPTPALDAGFRCDDDGLSPGTAVLTVASMCKVPLAVLQLCEGSRVAKSRHGGELYGVVQ